MTIAIRLSNAAATELYHSEYGSYEDHTPVDGGPAAARYGETHVCDLIMRGHRQKTSTRILLTDSEAAEFYYALCSGTFQLHDKGYFQTACRLADRLRDAARRHDADLVKHWPAPSGY